jgi:hypothetical protein
VENKTLKQTSKQTLKDEDLYLCEMTWNKKLSRIWYITLNITNSQILIAQPNGHGIFRGFQFLRHHLQLQISK